jgi:hypothetical protein
MRCTNRQTRLFVIVLALLWALSSPLEAAVAHVATIKVNDTTPGTTWTTTTVTPSTGELLIVGLVAYRSGGTFTVTATWNGNALTEDKTITSTNGADVFRASIFSLPNVTSATAGVAFTFSAATDFKTAFVMRVSGAATSSITDGTGGSATGSSTTPATGAMTSTNSDDFWVSVMGNIDGSNPSTVTAGAGWTIPTNGSETNGASEVVGGIEYIANPGATSKNGQWTITSSQWNVVGMAYKASAGGGATATPRQLLLGCCQ